MHCRSCVRCTGDKGTNIAKIVQQVVDYCNSDGQSQKSKHWLGAPLTDPFSSQGMHMTEFLRQMSNPPLQCDRSGLPSTIKYGVACPSITLVQEHRTVPLSSSQSRTVNPKIILTSTTTTTTIFVRTSTTTVTNSTSRVKESSEQTKTKIAGITRSTATARSARFTTVTIECDSSGRLVLDIFPTEAVSSTIPSLSGAKCPHLTFNYGPMKTQYAGRDKLGGHYVLMSPTNQGSAKSYLLRNTLPGRHNAVLTVIFVLVPAFLSLL